MKINRVEGIEGKGVVLALLLVVLAAAACSADRGATASGNDAGSSENDGGDEGAASGYEVGSGGGGNGSGAGMDGGGAGGGEVTDAGTGPDSGERGGENSTPTAEYPLAQGMGPETADDCPTRETRAGSATTMVVDSGEECFFDQEQATSIPAATAEYIVEYVDDVGYVHLRVTFDPTFVDNTYGENSIGWEESKDGIHEFKKLVGSDHVELLLTDGNGDTAMQFRVDYISEDDSQPSGYGTLGVTDGDGEMIAGDEADVLEVATSFDRNLNGCGYGSYTTDSPATDADYTPNPDTPNWDYRMIYEVWIDADAFGDAGFGGVTVEYVHASPSKASDNTIIVEEGECPPDWDVPYCVPNLLQEGENCGDPSEEGPCPDGYQYYIASGGASCLPVPVEGECPEGYVPDLASEGEVCVPEPA